jgi:hypothetical protein
MSTSRVINITPGDGRRHNIGDLVKVNPPFVPERFRGRVLPHVVIPRRSCRWSNARTRFVIPVPSRNLFDGLDNTKDFAKLEIGLGDVDRKKKRQ